MVTPYRGARHLGFALLALLCVLTLTACESTLSQPKPLLDQAGSGSAKLPAFTSRGLYNVAYSFDGCTGGVTGMTLTALDGTDHSTATLLQTAASDGSGSVAGRDAGTITLQVTSHCHWKVTVTG